MHADMFLINTDMHLSNTDSSLIQKSVEYAHLSRIRMHADISLEHRHLY